MDQSKTPRKSSVMQKAFSLEKSLKIPKSQQDDANISTDEDIQEKNIGFRSLQDKLEKNLELKIVSPVINEDIQEKKFRFKSVRDVVGKLLERQRGAKRQKSVSSEGSEEELSVHSFDNDEVCIGTKLSSLGPGSSQVISLSIVLQLVMGVILTGKMVF